MANAEDDFKLPNGDYLNLQLEGNSAASLISEEAHKAAKPDRGKSKQKKKAGKGSAKRCDAIFGLWTFCS